MSLHSQQWTSAAVWTGSVFRNDLGKEGELGHDGLLVTKLLNVRGRWTVLGLEESCSEARNVQHSHCMFPRKQELACIGCLLDEWAWVGLGSLGIDSSPRKVPME